jgi:hypothetical protein
MPALAAEHVDGLVKTGASTRVDTEVPPRFRPGAAVLARNTTLPPTPACRAMFAASAGP